MKNLSFFILSLSIFFSDSLYAWPFSGSSQKISDKMVQAIGLGLVTGTTAHYAYQADVHTLLAEIGKSILNYKYYKQTLAAATCGYLIACYAHSAQLSSIEKEINAALVAVDNKPFYAWKLESWQIAKRMWDDKTSVENNLKTFIKDAITKSDKLTQIKNEKQKLQDWIRYTGALCDVPEEFAHKIEEAGKTIDYSLTFSPYSSANKAICASQCLKDVELTLDLDENNNLLKEKSHNYFFYCKQWYNPLTWTFAPWSGSARKLCVKLLRLYGRLCVLEDIVQGLSVSTSKFPISGDNSSKNNVKTIEVYGSVDIAQKTEEGKKE